jgi:hypothetical protein
LARGERVDTGERSINVSAISKWVEVFGDQATWSSSCAHGTAELNWDGIKGCWTATLFLHYYHDDGEGYYRPLWWEDGENREELRQELERRTERLLEAIGDLPPAPTEAHAKE